MKPDLSPSTIPAQQSAAPSPLPLWPLPMVAAMLPAIASLIGLALYVDPAGVRCNPFVDDCVSISRMARHGLANHIFRMLVIPGAALQALTWIVAAKALSRAGMPRWQAWALGALGVGAAVALVVYASFLGSDGDVYRWLRRRGTIGYFAGTYVSMAIVLLASLRLHAADRLELRRVHVWAMGALLLFIAVVGIGHGIGSLRGSDTLENLTEWWAALALTSTFVVLAAMWWRWGVAAAILQAHSADRRPRTGNAVVEHPAPGHRH